MDAANGGVHTAALARFYEMAGRPGAYEAQADAGDAANVALELLAQQNAAQAISALEEMVTELNRLLINISCRINLRRPEVLRPLRTRLTAVRRRALQTLKLHGVANPNSRSGTGSSPRRIANRGQVCDLLNEIGPRHLCEHGCFFREHEPYFAPHRTLFVGCPAPCVTC